MYFGIVGNYNLISSKVKGFDQLGGNIMMSVLIKLNTIEKVRSFVNLISKYDGDFQLERGRYVVDAKSIMGIFSLNLAEPLRLNVISEDNMEHLFEQLSLYMI